LVVKQKITSEFICVVRNSKYENKLVAEIIYITNFVKAMDV